MEFVLNEKVSQLASYLTKQDARLLKPRRHKPGTGSIKRGPAVSHYNVARA